MTSRQIRDAARKCDCPGCAEEEMLAREAHLRAWERAVVEAAVRWESEDDADATDALLSAVADLLEAREK